MENFFDITMYISVVLVYIAGILLLIGLIAKLSVWTLDKVLISRNIRKEFLSFIDEKYKKNVYTPKLKKKEGEEHDTK